MNSEIFWSELKNGNKSLMNKHEIERYFRLLSKRIDFPSLIILTGAGAGTIYGNIRATFDIDFALKIKTRSEKKKTEQWNRFQEASHAVTVQTGIAAQYAEDIDRWSSITYLDYGKHTKFFKRFGTLEIRFLEPVYWAIGKLTRFLEPDIRDLCQVLKATKTSSNRLSRLLGIALRKSPKSTACELFRRQVEHFFQTMGPKVWGKNFQKEKVIKNFHKAARIT